MTPPLRANPPRSLLGIGSPRRNPAGPPEGTVITTEIIEAITGGGQYVVRGFVTPTAGPARLVVGQQVQVAWEKGRPVAILAGQAQRAQFGPLGPDDEQITAGVEELFVAPRADGILDVWFRNDVQTTPLGLSALLPLHPASLADINPPNDLNLRRVRWGTRPNTFLVWTQGPASNPARTNTVHTVFLARDPARPIGAAAVAVDHVVTWTPAKLPTVGIPVITVSFDGRLTASGEIVVVAGEGAVANGEIAIFDSTAVVATRASLSNLATPSEAPGSYSTRLTDVFVDDQHHLLGVIEATWAGPRSGPPFVTSTGTAGRYGSPGYHHAFFDEFGNIQRAFTGYSWFGGPVVALVDLTTNALLWSSGPANFPQVRNSVYVQPEGSDPNSPGAEAVVREDFPGAADVTVVIGPAVPVDVTPDLPPDSTHNFRMPPVVDTTVTLTLHGGLTGLAGFPFDPSSLLGVPQWSVGPARYTGLQPTPPQSTYPLTQTFYAYYFIVDTDNGPVTPPDPFEVTGHYKRVVVTQEYELVAPSFSTTAAINYVPARRPPNAPLAGRLFTVYSTTGWNDGVTPDTQQVVVQDLPRRTVRSAFQSPIGPVTLVRANDLVALWSFIRDDVPNSFSLRVTNLATGASGPLIANASNAQGNALLDEEPWLLRANVAYAAREPTPHLVRGWDVSTPVPAAAAFFAEQTRVLDADGTVITGALAALPPGVARNPVTGLIMLRLIDVQAVPAPEDRLP